jgi:hypothetical protein
MVQGATTATSGRIRTLPLPSSPPSSSSLNRTAKSQLEACPAPSRSSARRQMALARTHGPHAQCRYGPGAGRLCAPQRAAH